MKRQHVKHLLKKDAGVPSTKPGELGPMVLDAGKGEGIQVEIRACGGGLDQRQGKARQGNDRVGIGWNVGRRGFIVFLFLFFRDVLECW